jgi:hypothetical protein
MTGRDDPSEQDPSQPDLRARTPSVRLSTRVNWVGWYQSADLRTRSGALCRTTIGSVIEFENPE